MHYVAILLATICFGLIDASRNCTNCGPEGCSDLERPVVGKPQKDRFCRPPFTPPWEKDKLRKCVCKRGFVRNSWGECISKKNCWRCKLRRYKDWHSCASACPTTCGQPVLKGCPKKCSPGCQCIPGSVVHLKHHHRCVKADTCPPKCPLHSTFKPCVSSCEPKCSEEHPQKCVDRCDTGGCVCDQGYAYFYRNREKICVRESECSLFAPPPLSFTSKEIEQFNRGEGAINQAGDVGRNREGTPSSGVSRGLTENPSLGTPLPGAAGLGGNLEGARPSGMSGGAGRGEGEVTGPSPFNGGLAGEALNFLRERMPPSAIEGVFRTGTGLSTGLASRPSLGELDHNAHMRSPEGDFLSRGFEGRGGANVRLEPFVPPLQNAPISGGTTTSENAVNEPLHVSSLPGGLRVENEKGTSLSSLSPNRLPEEPGMRPGAEIAIDTLRRGPTGEGPGGQPGLGQPHGASERGVARFDESEEITQPLPVAVPGPALSEDLRSLPRTPESEFGIETRRSDVDIGMFGPPPPSMSGREEDNTERLGLRMPPSVFERPGKPGFGTLPSSATVRGLGSESNNNESARSREPSATAESGERDVSVVNFGTASPVTAGDRSGEAELQPIGPVTSSGVMPGTWRPESGVSERLEVLNRGETEEITSGPRNVRPEESNVVTGTGRTEEPVRGRNFPLDARTRPVARPLFGTEEYRNAGSDRGSFSAVSRGLLGYDRVSVGMPRQRTSFDVTPGYGRHHFAFYYPRPTARGAANLGESGFGERARYINPLVGIETHGSNVFTEFWNRVLSPAGAENRLPGGMGSYVANTQPFFRIPYRHHGAGVNADVVLRVRGVPGYGGGSARRHPEDIFGSHVASHAGTGFRFLSGASPIAGRREYGGAESPLNRGATNLGALTEHERARLGSFLVPSIRASLRYITARHNFLPSVTPVNFSVGYNGAYLSAVVRDALLRADIAGRGTAASGLYDGRASSGHISLHNGNRFQLRPEGYHGTRSVEYQLARLSESP